MDPWPNCLIPVSFIIYVCYLRLFLSLLAKQIGTMAFLPPVLSVKQGSLLEVFPTVNLASEQVPFPVQMLKQGSDQISKSYDRLISRDTINFSLALIRTQPSFHTLIHHGTWNAGNFDNALILAVSESCIIYSSIGQKYQAPLSHLFSDGLKLFHFANYWSRFLPRMFSTTALNRMNDSGFCCSQYKERYFSIQSMMCGS